MSSFYHSTRGVEPIFTRMRDLTRRCSLMGIYTGLCRFAQSWRDSTICSESSAKESSSLEPQLLSASESELLYLTDSESELLSDSDSDEAALSDAEDDKLPDADDEELPDADDEELSDSDDDALPDAAEAGISTSRSSTRHLFLKNGGSSEIQVSCLWL